MIDSSVGSPAGLSVDWVTRKIYWTDTELKRIEVTSLEGNMRAVLIWKVLDQPRDIVVDPLLGFVKKETSATCYICSTFKPIMKIEGLKLL